MKEKDKRYYKNLYIEASIRLGEARDKLGSLDTDLEGLVWHDEPGVDCIVGLERIDKISHAANLLDELIEDFDRLTKEVEEAE